MQKEHANAYDIFIDVFAEIEGWLTWDPAFLVDKNLFKQHLFNIESEDHSAAHYFNPFDIFLGKTCGKVQEVFDWRVTPVLFREPEENLTPLGPEELWQGFGMNRRLLAKVSEASTHDLKQLAEKHGYRVVSHQHCPEPLSSFAWSSSHLSQNLHTFVRAVGHKIEPEKDRDSKILARLKLGPPRHVHHRDAHEKEKVRLQDTSGYSWSFIQEPAGHITVNKQGKYVKSLSIDYELPGFA